MSHPIATALLRPFLFTGCAIAALSAAAPLGAAEMEAKSRIAAVTVYPDGAIVNRSVDVDLPAGSTLLVFRGLPATIDPASLRVEGQASGALTLGSVESRMTPADPGKATGPSDEQLRTLRLDRDRLATDLESLESRRAMIQRYAQAGPDRQGEQGRSLEVEKWAQAWEAVGAALTRVNEDVRRARLAIRDVEDKIRAIEAADSARRQRTTPEREFTLALEAGQALKGTLTLSYRVGGASWRPAYDATLETGEGGKAAGLKLTRRALVTQRTGEDWSDVAMTLSTQLRSGAYRLR
ncbi:MAG TPA: mucoidy inhibitor MuiA family protein, partial [Beijerinckiaceae bacterium]|nr:mucoidy inhibitor MuiA family protein [Beijerinckiaceae bacterium]